MMTPEQLLRMSEPDAARWLACRLIRDMVVRGRSETSLRWSSPGQHDHFGSVEMWNGDTIRVHWIGPADTGKQVHYAFQVHDIYTQLVRELRSGATQPALWDTTDCEAFS